MAKPHILIVEDNWEFYTKLSEYLILQGFSVDEFTPSYDAGLERISMRLPDVISMDIVLKGSDGGGRDGIDLAHAIRKKHNIPIIFLSEVLERHTKKRALQTLPFMYFTKQSLVDLESIFLNIEIALQDQERGYQPKVDVQGFRIGNQIVQFNEVLFITSDHNTTFLHTANKEYHYHRSMSWLETNIPNPHFVRVHKQHIANLVWHDDIRDGVLFFRIGNRNVPVGKAYFPRVKTYLRKTGL